MTVRVIRVLEYEYTDQAAANFDMANWKISPQDIKSFRSDTTIRSSVILPYDLSDEGIVNKSEVKVIPCRYCGAAIEQDRRHMWRHVLRIGGGDFSYWCGKHNDVRVLP